MSKIPVIDPNLYNIEILNIDSISIDDYDNDSSTKINRFYWYPNRLLINKLETHLFSRLNINDGILDAACGVSPFPSSTHILDNDFKDDINNITKGKKQIKFDLNFEKFNDNIRFNFIYSRHTLEDLQNPQNAFNQLTKISSKGYIETPSPLIEFSRGVDADLDWVNSDSYRGYKHHRYIVWSDVDTNTLYFLPKYPIIEYCNVSDNIIRLMNYIANNYPLYWNNYYYWDKDDDKKTPKICVLNDINFKDYNNYLTIAINKSIEYTKHFMNIIL
jgi:hypothetical protein